MNPLMPEPANNPGRNVSLGATGGKAAKPDANMDSEGSIRFRDTLKASSPEQQKVSKAGSSTGPGVIEKPGGAVDQAEVETVSPSAANAGSPEVKSQVTPELVVDIAPVEGQVVVVNPVEVAGSLHLKATSTAVPSQVENAGRISLTSVNSAPTGSVSADLVSAEKMSGEKADGFSLQLTQNNSNVMGVSLSVPPVAEGGTAGLPTAGRSIAGSPTAGSSIVGRSIVGQAPADVSAVSADVPAGAGRLVDAASVIGSVVGMGTGATDAGKPGTGALQNLLAEPFASLAPDLAEGENGLNPKVTMEKPSAAVTNLAPSLSFQAAYTKANLDWQFANRTQALEPALTLEMPMLSGNSTSTPSTGAYTAMSSMAGMQINEVVTDHRVQMPVNIKFGQPEWAGMVAERTAMMAAQKISFAELQLDPPELGPLQVRVTVQHDQASVNFVSANPAVRDSLEQTAVRLREMLDQQGVDLVDVNVADHSGRRRQDSGEGQDGAKGKQTLQDDLPAESVNLVTVVSSGIDHYV